MLKKYTYFRLGLIIVSCAGLTTLFSQQAVHLEKSALTEVEELSESLANRLLDLSIVIRDRNFETISTFFATEIQASNLPFPPFPSGKTIKWIDHNFLDIASDVPWKTRLQLIREWKKFLAAFSELEDVRFKVQNAQFRDTPRGKSGDGKIKFFLVGRDQSNKRLWVKGTGHILANQSEKTAWEISSLTFDHLETLRSNSDLFSEVSLPAGVSISIPPYGSPGNDNFVYHGAAVGDVNLDGFVDIITTDIQKNHIYLNRGGTFHQPNLNLGLPPTPQATAPLLLDYDNDGDLDLFLAAVGHQWLFQNQLVPEGKLLFTDVSLEAGVALPAVGYSATAGDINGDGQPDIYVASYNHYGRIMPNSWHQATNGTANLLFINQGNGSFKESSKVWGVRDMRWSYSSQMADVNGDGKLDLYVANDFGENALYINLGNSFEDQALSAGVLDPGNGMGVSFGDYNNDGHLDLYVTNMSSTAGKRVLSRIFPQTGQGKKSVLNKLAAGNSLFQGRSDGSFSDVTEEMGPFVTGWGWGGVFLDFDNDGWEDIYCPNGFISGKSMKDT